MSEPTLSELTDVKASPMHDEIASRVESVFGIDWEVSMEVEVPTMTCGHAKYRVMCMREKPWKEQLGRGVLFTME